MFDCDRDLKWKIFKDVCYFCAMTTPGGDRNELDARFVSLCATLNINRPTDAIAFNIYRSILRGHLADFSPILHPISDTLIKITLRLFRVRLFFFCIVKRVRSIQVCGLSLSYWIFFHHTLCETLKLIRLKLSFYLAFISFSFVFPFVFCRRCWWLCCRRRRHRRCCCWCVFYSCFNNFWVHMRVAHSLVQHLMTTHFE